MDHFHYRGGSLCCEDVPVAELAQRFGTPLYVYSRATILGHFEGLSRAFAALRPLICYSIKSCPNTHLVRLLAAAGSGFDVVSGGELVRALRGGARPESIVFAGVGKTDAEMREALAAGIGLFNAESAAELERLEPIADERGATARVALRVNPDVDARTHRHTTTGTRQHKFGVPIRDAPDVFARFADRRPVRLAGIHLHIGSPVHDLQAWTLAMTRGVELIDELRRRGHALDTIDVGGGFGAHYSGQEAPPPDAYARGLAPLLEGRELRVILEPGRLIVANAGVLVTRVLHVKPAGERRFVIVDAAMTDLIRPALYDAYHFIWPVHAGDAVPQSRGPNQPFDGLAVCDVVGPVCESADYLARDRALPPVQRGDLLAVFTAGAYGMSMASQYNSRLRPAEVLVDQRRARLIRRRETIDDLLAPEQLDAAEVEF